MASAQEPTVTDPLAGNAKYKWRKSLNRGTFGFVNLYQNEQTGELVAIKFLVRGERVNKYVKDEIQNHRILRHPHVIEFKEVFLTNQYICIGMEFASGGNLFNYVQKAQRLKEPAARWFFQQLIIGLDYCHKKGVVNRDIKLENTLLQYVPNLPLPLLKICDFGYSKAHFMSAPKSKVGTLAYMAPEVIGTTGNYDGKSADIWSCGIMLYVMLFGMYPFDGPHVPQPGAPPAAPPDPHQQRAQVMMNRIINMQWSIPAYLPPISPQCQDLLQQLIVSDPTKRLTMEQIQKHPWFLANLPGDALSMNDQCLSNADYTGVQSVEDIHAILRDAPIRTNMSAVEEDDQYEDLVDEMMQQEPGMSGSYSHVQAQAGQAKPQVLQQPQQQQLQQQQPQLQQLVPQGTPPVHAGATSIQV